MEEQKVEKDFNKINAYVKEFLDFNGYNSTRECFEAEEKTKKVTKKVSAPLNRIPTVRLPFKFRRKTWNDSHACIGSTRLILIRLHERSIWSRT